MQIRQNFLILKFDVLNINMSLQFADTIILNISEKLVHEYYAKGKVGRAPPECRRGAHLPFIAIEPVGG